MLSATVMHELLPQRCNIADVANTLTPFNNAESPVSAVPKAVFPQECT